MAVEPGAVVVVLEPVVVVPQVLPNHHPVLPELAVVDLALLVAVVMTVGLQSELGLNEVPATISAWWPCSSSSLAGGGSGALCPDGRALHR